MARTAASANIRTYVPDEAQDAKILDFINALEAAGRAAPDLRPALIAGNGERFGRPRPCTTSFARSQQRCPTARV